MNFTDFMILIDSRLPAGGHIHSGGIAPAIESGLINNISILEESLASRLIFQGPMQAAAVVLASKGYDLNAIDNALNIRMQSKFAREASKFQGKGLIRVTEQVWPEIKFNSPTHHHPVVFGRISKYFEAEDLAPSAYLQQTLANGASAAIRLLGLDPVSITKLLSKLNPLITDVVTSVLHVKDIEEIPAGSLPGLEGLAESYSKAQVRLFAS